MHRLVEAGQLACDHGELPTFSSSHRLPRRNEGDGDKQDARSRRSCVCQLLLSPSEKLCFQLKGTPCPRSLSPWDKKPPRGPPVEMNWTNCGFRESRASPASQDTPTPLLCSGKTDWGQTEQL